MSWLISDGEPALYTNPASYKMETVQIIIRSWMHGYKYSIILTCDQNNQIYWAL